MHKGIFLSLGGNVGDVQANFADALEALEARKVHVVKESALYKTEPIGITDQDWFFNQVVEVETELSPLELLYACLATEEEIGRIRNPDEKWGPRPIDVDLLFYHDQVINTTELTVPHPELVDRRFILVPLSEIAPDFRHPTRRKTIQELLTKLNETDAAEVIKV